MNVVMLSEHDYAGSGWQIAQAVRRHTDHSVVHVKATPHKYGYKTDFVLGEKTRPIIEDLVARADIVHFKGDDLPTRSWNGISIPKKARIIVTVGGSFFRRNGKVTRLSPISQYVKRSDFRTALSPDLNYGEFKGVYTQYLIDSESVEYCYRTDCKFVIGCYPGGNGEKGVESIVNPVLERLRKEGHEFEVVPTVGMTHGQSVEVKRRVSLFIDQISVAGCYGNSALEAMQFGVPVVAYMSDQSSRQATDGFRNSPVLNSGKTKEELYLLLEKILSKKVDLREISKRTKRYCDGFHSYSVGAKMWDEIYGKVASGNV